MPNVAWALHFGKTWPLRRSVVVLCKPLEKKIPKKFTLARPRGINKHVFAYIFSTLDKRDPRSSYYPWDMQRDSAY